MQTPDPSTRIYVGYSHNKLLFARTMRGIEDQMRGYPREVDLCGTDKPKELLKLNEHVREDRILRMEQVKNIHETLDLNYRSAGRSPVAVDRFDQLVAEMVRRNQ